MIAEEVTPVGHTSEFRRSWQPLLAACLGLVAGTSSIYINNLFSASLLAEFGWSKAEFALVGLTTAIAVICLPIAGRLTDRYGMRRVATTGVVALPLILIALALQPGGFVVFFVLSMAQMLVVSALAGTLVYGRLVVAYFHKSRGLALGLASCAPALVAMLISPGLGGIIEALGWRAGYFTLAACVTVLGAIALSMVPRGFRDVDQRPPELRTARCDYGELLRNRAFVTIFLAMLLCNIHFTLQTTQLAMIVSNNEARSTTAMMVSVFAFGVILGRVGCGLALDRFPSKLVASICFLFPACGLAALAVGPGNALIIALALGSLGFSVGAEGDIAAYLATRYFRPELFSTVLGMFSSAMAASALGGALLVSRMLSATGSYSTFLGIAAGCVLAGALSFQLLGREGGFEQTNLPGA